MNVPVERAHLVGVGGAGLSGLARLLKGAGVEVVGTDEKPSPVTDGLLAEGIEVRIGHRAENLRFLDGWCVRSAAVPLDNPEVREAARRGLGNLLYAEAVGNLSATCKTITVAGTHGKTSTTAMTVCALRESGIVPSHLIGGEIPELGGNGRAGASDVFVIEACEFNRSFLNLTPFAAAILNVDADHFDCYPEIEDLDASFRAYAERVRPDGVLVVHEMVRDGVFQRLPTRDLRVIRVGSGLFADLRAVEVDEREGYYRFTPLWRGRRLPAVQLGVRGAFHVHNALAALALAVSSGADEEAACHGVSRFGGVRRRFEIHRGPGGGVLVNDYAHHPAEIRAVLQTARRAFPGQRLVVAFQPHQHLRTHRLLPEFAEALTHADHCLVADIYGAREAAEIRGLVSARDLASRVRELGGVADGGVSLGELPRRIVEEWRPGDLVLILGAGDIADVVEELVQRL
jgi:UDP-N-acetylmuramate--alanine ligase